MCRNCLGEKSDDCYWNVDGVCCYDEDEWKDDK